MISNTPFGIGSTCGCGGGGPNGMPFGHPPDPVTDHIAWNTGNSAGATNVCGNVATSPISCSGCCGDALDVLPPYVPSPADLSIAPTCTPL